MSEGPTGGRAPSWAMRRERGDWKRSATGLSGRSSTSCRPHPVGVWDGGQRLEGRKEGGREGDDEPTRGEQQGRIGAGEKLLRYRETGCGGPRMQWLSVTPFVALLISRENRPRYFHFKNSRKGGPHVHKIAGGGTPEVKLKIWPAASSGRSLPHCRNL